MTDIETLTDAELAVKHGDHQRWSIRRYREEAKRGETILNYIDWRADKLWCQAKDARS